MIDFEDISVNADLVYETYRGQASPFRLLVSRSSMVSDLIKYLQTEVGKYNSVANLTDTKSFSLMMVNNNQDLEAKELIHELSTEKP